VVMFCLAPSLAIPYHAYGDGWSMRSYVNPWIVGSK
jgi:hypothetical protein